MPAWSLDPIYFDNVRVTRHDLDRVSATRPIGIMHASGHILNVNTRALELAGLMRTGVNHDRMPLGELKGPDVMTPVSPMWDLTAVCWPVTRPACCALASYACWRA